MIEERDYIVHSTSQGTKILQVVLKINDRLKCNYWTAYVYPYDEVTLSICKSVTSNKPDGSVDLTVTLLNSNLNRMKVIEPAAMYNDYNLGQTVYLVSTDSKHSGWYPMQLRVSRVNRKSIEAVDAMGSVHVLSYSTVGRSMFKSYEDAKRKCMEINYGVNKGNGVN